MNLDKLLRRRVEKEDEGRLGITEEEKDDYTDERAEYERAYRAKQEKALAEAEERAETDQLTGALNRRGFDREVEHAFARFKRAGEPFAIVMADIDNLKPINDTYGHDAGDAAICAFAETLRKSIRTTDFVARFGGDEFALILEASQTDPMVVVERCTATLKELTIERNGGAFTFSASFGMARADAGTPNITEEEVIRKADKELYMIKRAKKGEEPHALNTSLSQK